MDGELDGVGVAEHVVVEDVATHTGELDAAGTDGVVGGIEEAFATIGNGLEGAGFRSVVKAGMVPVAMRAKDAGAFAVAEAVDEGVARRLEEASCDPVPREGFEADVGDGKTVKLLLAVGLGVERGLGGFRPKPRADFDALDDMGLAFRPTFLGVDFAEGVVVVEGGGFGVPGVCGEE